MKQIFWLDSAPVLSAWAMACGLLLSKSGLAEYAGVWLLLIGLMTFVLWLVVYAVLTRLGRIKSGFWAMPVRKYFGPDGP